MSRPVVRHVNRNRPRSALRSSTQVDRPPQHGLETASVVLVGRYVDIEAEHSLADVRLDRAGSFAEYQEDLYEHNADKLDQGNFSLLGRQIFVSYVDITKAVNEKAKSHGKTARAIKSERSETIAEIRFRISELRSAHERELAKVALEKQQRLDELFGEGGEWADRDDLDKDLISRPKTESYWADGYEVAVSPQPRYLRIPHPNGTHLAAFPTRPAAESLEMKEGILSVLRASRVKSVPEELRRDQHPSLPFMAMHTEMSAIPRTDRPKIAEPPPLIPLSAMEVVTIDRY